MKHSLSDLSGLFLRVHNAEAVEFDHLASAVGPVLVDMLDRYEVYAGLGDG